MFDPPLLVIPPGFQKKLVRQEPDPAQLLIDGIHSATVLIVTNYARAIVEEFGAARLPIAPAAEPIRLATRVWYNAPLRSVNYVVPGLYGVILGIFLKGVGLKALWPQAVALAGIGVLLFAVALRAFGVRSS